MIKMNFKLALAGVVIIGLGVGVWLGTWQSGRQIAQAAAGRSAQGGATVASGAGATGGSAAAGEVTTGVVDTVGDQQFTVKPNGSGDPVTVRVASGTTISKQATGTIADIQKDQRVLVRGTMAADGTVSAMSFQIGGANAAAVSSGGLAGANGQARQGGFANGGATSGGNGQAGQGGAGNGSGQGRAGNGQARQGAAGNGGQNNPNAQNSNGSMIFGAVQSIDGNLVTIIPQVSFSGQNGAQSSSSNTPVKVNITAQTTINKVADASFQDIQSGMIAVVRGPSGVDGVVAATSVQLLPADAVQQFRRGQQ